MLDHETESRSSGRVDMVSRRKVSARAHVVHGLARTFLRPAMRWWPLTPITMAPITWFDHAMRLLPKPRGVRFERERFDGYHGEWARAADTRDDGAVLYFHGGAFLFCGLGTHRAIAAMLSSTAKVPVLSVAYRQLPAVPLLGTIEDCLGAYRSLLDAGYAPDRIVFAGDSAGGHLAFATALRAMANGLPGPGGLVAISPWLDFDASAKLVHENARKDAYIPSVRLEAIAAMCAGGVTPIDRMLSPVNHDLGELPPSLIIVAEGEILRADGELMATRLADAGVPCELQVWPGQVHAFPVLAQLLPESRAAVRGIGGFVRSVLARSETAAPAAPAAESASA
jgi:acetyl esterase/lipase